MSRWDLEAPRQRVWEVFGTRLEHADPFAWWPDLVVTHRDDDEVHVETRSGLGYRLRFRLHDLWSQEPSILGFAADGDLLGQATVLFEERGERANTVVITWDVAPTLPWMQRGRLVLAPVFRLTHAAVMRRGHRALRAELGR